jgi:cell division protein FtsX
MLLKKIIRSGIGRLRFWMAITGMGVAVLFILLAVQIHADFNELLHGENNANETADFLVINKKVTPQNQGQKEQNVFTETDIKELQTQPFTGSIGKLATTSFKVSVESYSAALPFYSDAYFESVPDEFIDVKSDEWKWVEGQRDIPVIIPSFFLDLYNTGMAMSQENLPQLSLEAIMAIPIKVTVRGNNQAAEFVGHVVGQSDRINSILIPQTFMDWANKQYGYRESPKPNRVVIKVKDPSDPALVNYLDKKGWKTNAEKTRFSRMRKVVNGVVAVTGGIGLVLLLFGLLVFSLFIQLTIASCKNDIELLQTLGTSPKQLERFLLKQFLPQNIILIVIALLFIAVLQWTITGILKTQQIVLNPWLSIDTIIAALAVLTVVYLVNKQTISRYIKK